MSLSRIGYLILAFTICWSAYYLFDKEQGYDIQVEPDTELPMFSGENLVNTSYNEAGIRSYVITSVNLDHYSKSGNTIFNQPVLKVYKEGTTLEWEVTAVRGVLSKDHVLTLYEDVLATNLLPDSGFDTLSTDVMNIQLDSRDFWADDQVIMVGPQFETLGQAMTGNFADNHATLYNRVQSRYETITP
ncbi:lipopolysaccharide assembly protein [Vibrio tubiashii]|nr:lipopolysaccharide assembly protein [Vibrio tubiashii]